MGVRENFYTTLWEQFRDDPSGSFLFRYLRNERRAEGRDFAQAPLDELFGLLANRNQKLRLMKEDQNWLWELGEHAGGTELREALERTRGDRARYKRILEALGSRPEVVTEQILNKLRRIVLDAVVMQDARTFLYDAGFSLNQKEDHPPRRNDRVLGMLDAWCRDSGLSLRRKGASGSGALTAEERQAWNEMFLLLQRMKAPTKVILPVRVDPRTGVGLYLVGIKCFTREVQQEMRSQRLKCVFVCLGSSDFYGDDEEIDEEIDEKIGNGFHLDMRPLKGDTVFCVNLEDGERMFSHILDSQSAYEFIRDWNATAPQGTPKLLQIYFRSMQKKSDRASLVAEGRQKSEQDMKRSPSPGFR